MNNCSQIQLGRVAIPLVELLGSDGLSWSDREKCADALRQVLRHHQSLKSEAQQQMIGAVLAGQQRSKT